MNTMGLIKRIDRNKWVLHALIGVGMTVALTVATGACFWWWNLFGSAGLSAIKAQGDYLNHGIRRRAALICPYISVATSLIIYKAGLI